MQAPGQTDNSEEQMVNRELMDGGLGDPRGLEHQGARKGWKLLKGEPVNSTGTKRRMVSEDSTA